MSGGMLVLALWPAAGALQVQAHPQPQTSGKATKPDARSDVDTEGFSHAAWQLGQNSGSMPFNFGPAVKLSGTEADVVCVQKRKGATVVNDWISGWRSSLSLDPSTPLRLRHWAPDGEHQGRRVA